MNECNVIQQAANPSATTTKEAANTGSGNEETTDENSTATTAAATPCPEVCEQTQNTGECPAGDQTFFLGADSWALLPNCLGPNYPGPNCLEPNCLELFKFPIPFIF